ncbi:MAG: hypothetical protein AB2L18_02805 [Anaerolineaceae bacterium]
MMISKKNNPFLQKYGYICLFCVVLLIFLFYPNEGIYDWDKEVLYTAYIKASLLEFKQFPLFLWNSAQLSGYPAVDQSAFFAANPETMLFTPFLPLLLLFSPQVFLKLLVVLNGTLGVAGVLALGKKLRWQPRQTSIFSALFLFSPIVIQHVAIGYLPWINLYLFPWLLVFLLSDKLLTRSLGSGMVLALVLLQGGLHVFVWLTFFVVLFVLCIAVIRKKVKELLTIPLTFLVAIGMALPRFYLSLQSFASFAQRFFSGYSLKAFLKWGLVPPFFTPTSMDDIEYFIEGYIDGVPYWDGEVFWGAVIVLAALLPFFFLYLHKKNHQSTELEKATLAIACASAILVLFSLGGFYEKLITFISELLQLPALQGMEKYPFRFAIPAYFGFAFVIAACWMDWPGFFVSAAAFIDAGLKKLLHFLRQCCAWLKIRRNLLSWLAGIPLVLYLMSLIGKPILLAWLQARVKLAYSGQGAVWLAGLMEQTASIPLENYLAKEATLYSYVQHILLGIVFFFAFLWILGIVRIPNREKKISPTLKYQFSPWILEVLLVLPLLLAFGMWWRVALATPQDTLTNLKVDAPEISMISEQDSAQVAILSFSPLSVNFTVRETRADSGFVLDSIPASDAQFLEIAMGNASFINNDGKLGIQVEQDGEIDIRVNQKIILIPSLIAGLTWLICLGILLWLKKQDRIVSRK